METPFSTIKGEKWKSKKQKRNLRETEVMLS